MHALSNPEQEGTPPKAVSQWGNNEQSRDSGEKQGQIPVVTGPAVTSLAPPNLLVSWEMLAKVETVS